MISDRPVVFTETDKESNFYHEVIDLPYTRKQTARREGDKWDAVQKLPSSTGKGAGSEGLFSTC